MTTTTQFRALPHSSALLDRMAWITFFIIVTGLSAWVEIPLPFTPVPITLQTFAVVASGVVLGTDGVIAQLLCLLLGGMGVPMFSGGSWGWHVFLGATGGYLIGFVA